MRHAYFWRFADFAIDVDNKILIKILLTCSRKICLVYWNAASSAEWLLAGISAGIEAAFHSAKEVVDGNHETDDGVFVLLARNANDLNRYMMLKTIRYLWSSDWRISFNCYSYWSSFAIRGRARKSFSLNSKHESSFYGNLRIGRLALISKVKIEYNLVRYMWCADEHGAGATFNGLKSTLTFYKFLAHPTDTHLT